MRFNERKLRERYVHRVQPDAAAKEAALRSEVCVNNSSALNQDHDTSLSLSLSLSLAL